MRDGYIKSLSAATDIGACLLVAFTAIRGQVTLATGPTVPLAGFVDTMGAKAGALCDVQLDSVADAKAGGVIAAGDPITADANGKAVKAVKVVGQTVYCIGFAQEPAVADDIVPVKIDQFLIVG